MFCSGHVFHTCQNLKTTAFVKYCVCPTIAPSQKINDSKSAMFEHKNSIRASSSKVFVVLLTLGKRILPVQGRPLIVCQFVIV